MDEAFSDEEIVHFVRKFLKAEATSREAKQILVRYVQEEPECANPDPIIPTEELEIKLELITKLQKSLDGSLGSDSDGKFHFTYLQLSYFLLIPIAALRDFSQGTKLALNPYLAIESYLNFMVRGRIPVIPLLGKRPASGASNNTGSGSKSIRRDTKEREKCVARDNGACILTRCSYPEICHIVPFAVNSNEQNIAYYFDKAHLIHPFLSDDSSMRLGSLLAAGQGCSDKCWNMISLHPTLHDWWGRCLFGLRCLGIIPKDEDNSIVQVQFHWMPKNDINCRERTEPSKDAIQRMLQTVAEQDSYAITAESRKYSSRRLETGQLFNVTAQNEDAAKMKIMLDVQWANTKLAAISGAAGIWEIPTGPDESDSDAAQSERIEAWLDDLHSGTLP